MNRVCLIPNGDLANIVCCPLGITVIKIAPDRQICFSFCERLND
jgi:hypothetical protein